MSTPERETPDELAPARYLRTVDPIAGPRSAGEHALEQAYADAMLHASAARQQLVLLDDALAHAGLAAMLLKGSSHLLWLYDGALPRKLSDIDILVRSDELQTAAEALGRLGFVPEPANSPEDARLQAEEGPGLRYLRSGMLPVDLQTRFPGVRCSDPALDEARGRVTPAFDAPAMSKHGLRRLHPMDEMLVAASHLGQHLMPPLTVAPKWLTDMLLLVAANRGVRPAVLPPDAGVTPAVAELIWPFAPFGQILDDEALWRWDDFWNAARRWGTETDAQRACACLNAYWNAGVPGVRQTERLVSLERLAGEHDRQHAMLSAASIPAAYAERLARMRSLAGFGPRARFLAGLVFPSPADLRRRYRLASDAWLLPHYLVHPWRTTWKVVRGLAALARLRAAHVASRRREP